MSGHSKWATTKHKKAVVDARRGKLFAKLIKNIEVAAPHRRRRSGRQPHALRRHPEGTQELGARWTTSTVPSSAAPARTPAAPTGRRSCTRATARTGWRSSSSASPTTATAPPPRCGWR